jgi:hypothetical protein
MAAPGEQGRDQQHQPNRIVARQGGEGAGGGKRVAVIGEGRDRPRRPQPQSRPQRVTD